MQFVATLSRWGFVPAKFGFAFRTAFGACLALLFAWAIGLEHPQWSAMTVWAASQPMRGMLIEKSLFRAVGTLFGTIVGVGLVLVANGDPLVLTLGVAIWVGLCTGVGNLLRGFVAYGALLSGYSASMVALLGTATHTNILTLGVDRFFTVMVGVIMALVVGLLFATASSRGELWQVHGRQAARTFRTLAHWFGAPLAHYPSARSVLKNVSDLSTALETHDAGSLSQRRYVKRLRALLIAQMDLLLDDISRADARPSPQTAAALLAVADTIGKDDAGALRAAVQRVRELTPDLPKVQTFLDALLMASDQELHSEDVEQMVQPAIHRDWIGARNAAVRSLVALLVVGGVWVVTGWSFGPYMMLGTAVMVSLFSTWENPAAIMVQVFIGQVAGAVMFLLVRWLVWPSAGSELMLVLQMLPFIMVGALPLSHKKTALGAYDFSLVFLLLAQPIYPLTGDFLHTLYTAMAVVTAPLVALLAFKFVYPTDAAARTRDVLSAMVHDVAELARKDDPLLRQIHWNVRFYYRLLRLQRWANNAGDYGQRAIGRGLGLFSVGEAVFALHALQHHPQISSSLKRIGRLILGRLGNLELVASHRLLHQLAERLQTVSPRDAAVLDAASRGLGNVPPSAIVTP